MTEGPYKLPEGWRWVRLGEFARVCYGRANPKRPGVVPVTGSGGVYDHTETPLIFYATVVIGRKGSAGESLLVREPCWPSDTTFYLEWRDDTLPDWVDMWLRIVKPSPEGTTATLPSLRREDLESQPVPLPPLAEQRRIVAHLEAVQDKIKAMKQTQATTEAELRRLEQAILDKAFRGEL